jgi:hypothetical protein
LCEELLAQCPTDRGPSPLPVLASCQGVRACRAAHILPAAGCSGLLIPADGGYEIVVCSDEPEGRQNFSTAHEIIHTFFREVGPAPAISAEEEKLCNLGAAILTMPAARFGRFLAARPLCFATIDECHREFAVSVVAAGRRAMTLTDASACLFLGTMTRTKKQIRFRIGTPKLRITKWWQSDRWPFTDSHLNLPILDGSVIGDAFSHQDHRAGHGSLGIAFRPGNYEVEARGYGYSLPGNPQHRQVLALACGPLDGLTASRCPARSSLGHARERPRWSSRAGTPGGSSAAKPTTAAPMAAGTTSILTARCRAVPVWADSAEVGQPAASEGLQRGHGRGAAPSKHSIRTSTQRDGINSRRDKVRGTPSLQSHAKTSRQVRVPASSKPSGVHIPHRGQQEQPPEDTAPRKVRVVSVNATPGSGGRSPSRDHRRVQPVRSSAQRTCR